MGIGDICEKCLLRESQFSFTDVACYSAASPELTLESRGVGDSNLWD